MTATLVDNVGGSRPALYVAFELGWSEWKLAFGTGPADAPRLRNIGGRNLGALEAEIAKAKKRFGLPETCPVFCCYEAGRDRFWLHRYLTAHGIVNNVVDSSSIEVKRRGRRRKTDRLDAGKLLSMLIRWHQGGKCKDYPASASTVSTAFESATKGAIDRPRR